MGYYAYSYVSNVTFKEESKEQLVSVLKEKFPSESVDDMYSEIAIQLGCTFFMDENNLPEDIHFEYVPYHEQDVTDFLCLISPFVDPGSTLEFMGDDNSAWAFYFNGDCAKRYDGVVVYPGMPAVYRPNETASKELVDTDEMRMKAAMYLHKRIKKTRISLERAVEKPNSHDEQVGLIRKLQVLEFLADALLAGGVQ